MLLFIVILIIILYIFSSYSPPNITRPYDGNKVNNGQKRVKKGRLGG